MTEQTPLAADKLRWVCDVEQFDFETTADLPELEEVLGQERAVRAVSFGINISSEGYHIYALGAPGTGKTTTIEKFLERASRDGDVPDDWLYVNNFDDRDKPDALRLPAGMGCEFRDAMRDLVESLEEEIPQAFEGEEYRQEQEQLEEEIQQRSKEIFEEVRAQARERDFTIMQTPQGVIIAPVEDGEPVPPDEFEKLDEDTRREYEKIRDELQEELRDAMREIQRLQDEGKERIKELDRQVVEFAVGHRIDDLRDTYSEYDDIQDYLDAVREDILQSVQEIKQREQADEQQMPPQMRMMAQRSQRSLYDRYRVNLIVDNSETDGAPVILERNANYHNLIGRIEHQAQFGALVTDFTMIKPGALHRANGGYLMLQARDVLTEPFAWEALKRTLMNGEIKIEPMAESYQSVSTRTLEPEPVPLDVKVIMTGNPMIYYLLYEMDEDFQELFKVKADFATDTKRTDEMLGKYAQFIAGICNSDNLLHFDRGGVAKVIEHGVRMVEDQEKLATRFGDVVDLLHQASYWAQDNGHEVVTADDVTQAINEQIYRSNRIEEELQELIDEDTLLIDTDGAVVGQVNGLAVLQLGDYAFGKPSRITTRVYAGNDGIVDIDRETELGGTLHNKGVLILAGYLGGEYAQERPLSLSASIAFEQQYSEVDGDSASSAELYSLLSALSGVPIKQGFAVTGSVNQRGEVQAIGGVNEKIEGFFMTCQHRGLTGEQGVLIPQANVKNLMLRDEVIEAVDNGEFHIYPVSHVTEGMQILTGEPMGERQDDGTYPDETINARIQERLQEFAERVREFSSDGASATDEG
jgi:lon-related putative ATP-dependent protease